MGFTFPSIISNPQARPFMPSFEFRLHVWKVWARKQVWFLFPLEDYLQNCSLMILPHGHRKTHKALIKEGKDGLYQAERIFSVICVGPSLEHETARSSPQIDAFSLHYTANTPYTDIPPLPLDHASAPWPQLCKSTLCLLSISFTRKSRISSISVQ